MELSAEYLLHLSSSLQLQPLCCILSGMEFFLDEIRFSAKSVNGVYSFNFTHKTIWSYDVDKMEGFIFHLQNK